MIQRTSIETYQEIKKSGLLSEKRMNVFDIFYENLKGLTGSEVSEIYKNKFPSSKHSETIRNRITELCQMGVLAEMGIVECPYTKRKVMKWCCVDRLPAPLEKKITLKDKIKDILDDVTEFGISLKSEEEKVVLRSIYAKIKSLN
jgi:hypothetical protein